MRRKSSYTNDLLDRLSDPVYAAKYLNIALQEAIADGFTGGLMVAIRHVVDSQGGVSTFAKKLQLKSRTSLYKTLNENGNPEFSSLIEILKHLHLDLKLSPRGSARRIPKKSKRV